MFFGSYEYTVDQKGRVPLPSKFRGEVGDKLYLLKGYEDCISLYKEEDFRKLIANIQNLPYERAKVRQNSRLLASSITEISVDKVGRIALPKKVISEHHIEKEVVVIGVIDHIEIWDTKKWDEYKTEGEKTFDIDAESLINTNEK